MKSLIETIFDFTKSDPPPIEVEDPDDYMGTAVWVTTRAEAMSLTSDDGGYAFSFDMPMEYTGLCWWVPCGLSPYPAQMRVRLYFCLYREGIPESQIQQLCQSYQAVVPWPMTSP